MIMAWFDKWIPPKESLPGLIRSALGPMEKIAVIQLLQLFCTLLASIILLNEGRTLPIRS